MEDNNKYYQSRHFLRLLHRYEKAISEGKTPYMEADELTDIAEYYMTGKQDAKANQAIQAAIDMHPDSVDPQIFLARQRMFYGKLDEARSIIDGITEQDDQEVIYIRAELLIKEGQADKASDFLLDRMSVMQDCLDTYLYDCVSIFMDYDQWELAHEWLLWLADKYPTHPRLPIMEAEIKMGLDDYEGAYTQLKTILDDEPYDSEAWNLLSETCTQLGYQDEAIEAADYSLAINPQDTGALLMKGNAYMHGGLTAEAIDLYKQYLDLQPDDLSIQISLSLCLCSEERFKEILPLLEKAEKYARKLPDHEAELSQILQVKAFALSRLDRISEAISTIEKAKEVTDEAVLWKCYMTEGDIYLWGKQTKLAEENFSKALERSPEKGDTLFNIALAYSNAGYNDVAIDLLDDVWTIFGTEEGKFVVPYLANCYLRKNDMENYLIYLKLAPSCDRDATRIIFRDRFPDIAPEEYYAYAYKEIHGTFPKDYEADLPF
ncbi:MAG: tetratricopeptide repeat protein [Bacteroidaceae bacterium]|nr:tetratricopeptide repeat protein [Bacteroidaceae bacterium]